MDSEDGELFIKQLAGFVRTHEKALANALQFRRQNSTPRHGHSQSTSSVGVAAPPPAALLPQRPSTSGSSPTTAASLASALSLGALKFTSHSVRSAKLALTPHHLFYLLSRFEELAIPVGPMKIRLENLHDSSTAANYVSFLSNTQRARSRDPDGGSVHSVSSVRSVMSGMSALWASFGLGASISAARGERQKAALQADLKYLYSAFTKIPCLRLAPDRRARLIKGYEEFPFDSAVPLYVFKNVQALEVSGIDFRQFFGWDHMADQLRHLTVKRAGVEDPTDILIDIVLDDMDRRRRRTSKAQASPTTAPALWPANAAPRRSRSMVHHYHHPELRKSLSAPSSPDLRDAMADLRVGSAPLSEHAIVDDPNALSGGGGGGGGSGGSGGSRSPPTGDRPSGRSDGPEGGPPPSKGGSGGIGIERPRSSSPDSGRPTSSRTQSASAAVHIRGSHHKMRRSGSGSSQSSLSDSWQQQQHGRGAGSGNLLGSILPSSKWRFLRHLGLPDNSMTAIPPSSLAPLANTLQSLDLSSNLFSQIPDSLATLAALRALNLAYCMIDSLHSLSRNPLPAITALNLRANRLRSIAGVERLLSLERLDLRDNELTDPLELARLTGIPDIREIWVEGNPLTKTHRGYRVTIFNLFRRTPGYTEDPTIDGTGPTYSERRQLVERVPIPAAVPVVRPPPPAPTVPAVDVGMIASSGAIAAAAEMGGEEVAAAVRKDRPRPTAVASESGSGSTRRARKTPKRRIVDLATSNYNDSGSSGSNMAGAPPPPPPTFVPVAPCVVPAAPFVVSTAPSVVTNLGDAEYHYRVSSQPQSIADAALPLPSISSGATAGRGATDLGPMVGENPRIESQLVPELPPGYSPGSGEDDSPEPDWKETRDWDAGGEMYRRKIEALRDKVGPGYLSVLSEEGWEPPRSQEYMAPGDPNLIRSITPLTRPPSAQPLRARRTVG